MAEELTQKEIEIFRDISAGVDEYDPGLDEFSRVMKRAEIFLNGSGGYDSMSYQGTLVQLNEQWEFLDQTATLSGKVYVLEDEIVELASGEWDGPYKDARGTYYMVDGAELMSLGIIDTLASDPGTVNSEGILDRPVELAYAFTPEDSDSDIPMFFAGPDHLLHATYDIPTMDAVVARLCRDIPDEIERLDKRIYKAGFDPMKLVKQLRKAITELQEQMVGNDDMQMLLTRYIFERIELDRAWPYGITVEGPAWYAEGNEPLSPIEFDSPSLHYLKSIGASLDEFTVESPRRVGMSLAFAVPSSMTDGEVTEGRLHIPLDSIKSMFSTRPMGSVRESVLMAHDAKERELYPEEATISIPDFETEIELHPKFVEYRRLVALEGLIKEMQSRSTDVRRTRHPNQRDALEVASKLAQWFHSEVMAIGVDSSDSIRVSGPGVIKASANLRQKERSLHVEVDESNAIINPTIATDIEGSYEGMLAEVDRYEDDDGREFWTPIPKMTLKMQEIHTPLVQANHPLLSVVVKSSTIARLDDSSNFELPELDRIRRRNEALTALATEQKSSVGLNHVRGIERAFFHESIDTWNEAGAMLKRIRRLARQLTEAPDDTLLEAFRQQLVGRRVQIAGDTWFGNGRSDDHINVGIITDMLHATLPDGTEELVVNVANSSVPNELEQQGAALVVLRTTSLLKF